ncbi:class I SAM-dependent methyltransferase [Bacillus sp. S/N-304-OC-R1]|uniref:class I SAM-dependent DNA methyltransferase n=1 Tax=Bacillus sp. S/N-304-OC-R1 TaxID=2758034 RepID=UPI001C8D4D56|nr:class I SAM-dependent methyltransferase [Bacillus sp. S/N-304-OC-R1]MBY0122760.1 class I SAM-dependent methyltransferase [Bacillus sp. S/N-304-OC-R1]
MNQTKATNNLEKYADPEMYDHLHKDYTKDFNVIVEWAQQYGQQQPIIELACGTGRVTIPMAKQGFKMIGVDIHEGMLSLAKEKAENEDLPIEFHLRDCTTLSLPTKSSFIYMTGNSFQHFLTNEQQDALFQAVRHHLNNRGLFIFDTRNPLLHELAVVDKYEQKYIDKKGDRVIEYHSEEYDSLTQMQHCMTKRHIYRKEELIAIEQDGISLRFTFPLEMKRLLHSYGFKILQVYGDWDKNELTAQSVQMIYICQINTADKEE